ncbi:MAG: MFS transporter [Syntrophobacteraceae bacterium]
MGYYHYLLLLIVGAVTFFDGYDFLAITQLLPNLQSSFGLNQTQLGLLIMLVNTGAIAAFLLMRAADTSGRRRLLLLTLAGFTLSSFASGVAPNVTLFGFFQFCSRLFLIADTEIAVVYVAEEFPAVHRGLAIGVLQGCFSLGAIACATLVPLLLKTPWGWRSVYLFGAVSVLTLLPARSKLRESRRFTEFAITKEPERRTFFAIWRSPYRRRMLQMGLVWAFSYACTQSTVMFWKEFVVSERGFTATEVGVSIALAALVAMPAVFLCGRLLDRVGRRMGALIVFGIEIVGAAGSYSLHGRWPLTAMLVLGIFGASSVQLVLNAFTAELFPTDQRGDAFAWSNNLLGRMGFVLSPLLIGYLASFGGWGRAVRLTAIGPLLALAMLLKWAPETNARELEETSKI